MNITLRQLRYFVEIARSRSFSRAAEHLAIAQPALSQNIAALEEDLDVVLFKRHARGVELSPAGRLLFDKAVDLLARTDALKQQVAGRDAQPSGAVRLSVAGSIAGLLVAPLLRAVAESFPGIELAVREGMSSEVRAQVESGQAQLAAMPSPSELQGMQSHVLFEERFMIFGAAVAMRRKPAQMTFDQVAALPLAEPDGAHDLRKIIERAASAVGKRLDVRYELNSPAMLIGVVREGLAFSIMPASACHDAVLSNAIVGRAVTAPTLTRVQAVVWPRDRPLSPAAEAVRDTMVTLVRAMVRDGRLHGTLPGDPAGPSRPKRSSHKKK
ncbi:LysR family transcriptional regulator [Variovorax sp. KK3]|uniref:LysR family transcriptional regulator n=1 Tax=Variovorax sp. KK3 TaxID=1855728 RepID=UPI0009F979E2|nr:LysR family transcriptional regulator [Variovorax sp. KK3]